MGGGGGGETEKSCGVKDNGTQKRDQEKKVCLRAQER